MKMKKTLAILLAAMLLMAAMPLAALAEPATPVEPEDMMATATALTVPHSGQYTLTEDTMFITPYGNNPGKLIKLELTKGEVAKVGWVSVDETADNAIDGLMFVYREDNSALVLEKSLDDDNLGQVGEEALIAATADATYYVLLSCYSAGNAGQLTMEYASRNAITELLDFTSDPLPAAGADAKWAWDAATKTLTLKDGFVMATDDDTIYLPGGSTVVVEGDAYIQAYYTCLATVEAGDLTVKLMPGAHLQMMTIDDDGIYIGDGKLSVIGTLDDKGNRPKATYEGYSEWLFNSNGDIVVENIELDITSNAGDAIEAEDGSITLKNCVGSIYADSDALYIDHTDEPEINPAHKLTLTDCELSIDAHDEGLDNAHGDIVLTNCLLYIYSYGGNAIESDSNSLQVSGGRLVAHAADPAIDAETVTLTDVVVNLHSWSGTILDIANMTGFTVPGTVLIIDDMGEELYKGAWGDEAVATLTTAWGIETVVPDGKFEDAAIDGVKASYTVGDTVTFTGVAGAPAVPQIMNAGWIPTSWVLENQNIKGEWAEGSKTHEGSFSTADLPAGKYKLTVTFTDSRFDPMYGYGWYDNITFGPMEEEIPAETKTLSVEFEVKAKPAVIIPDEKPPVEEEKSPLTGDNTTALYALVMLLAAGVLVTGKKFLKA